MAVLSNTSVRAGASAAGGGDAYQIEKSLRFEAEDAAYLNRTPSSAGNRKTWTWSSWVKRSGLGTGQTLFSMDGEKLLVQFTSSDRLEIYDYVGGYNFRLYPDDIFRDPAAWYHIVFVFDSTQATDSDRMSLYVNGVKATSFSGNSPVWPTQNYDSSNTATLHTIGRLDGSSAYFNGYLTDVHLIDGQALDADSFGETDATTGKWIAKEYAGTYGTNGFHLKFNDIYDQPQRAKTLTGEYWSQYEGAHNTTTQPNLKTGSQYRIKAGDIFTGLSDSASYTPAVLFGIDQFNASIWRFSSLTSTDAAHGGGFGTGAQTVSAWKSGYFDSTTTGWEDNYVSIESYDQSGYDDGWDHIIAQPTLAPDSSGNDNDWTVNNLTAGGPAWSDVLMPTWTTIGSDWTVNSDRFGTYSGSSYSWLISENLDTDKVYKFRFYQKDTSSYGGWCLCDNTNPNKTVPNEIYQEEGNSTAVASLGHRNQYSTVGTWGSYATANSTSEATGQLNIFSTLNPQEVSFDVVINRVVNKCWMRKVGESSWIGSGNPDTTTSASTFDLPDDTNMYWCFVGHSSQGTATITDGSPEVLETDTTADSPTDYDDGGNGAGNYATWNPLYHMRAGSGHYELAQGNRRAYDADSTYGFLDTTMYVKSGKWYADIWLNGGTISTYYDSIGIVGDQQHPNDVAGNVIGYWYTPDGKKVDTVSGYLGTTYGATYALGDVIGVAMDLDNGTVTFYKNGVSQGVAFNNINPEYSYSFAVGDYSNGVTFSYAHINTGSVPFDYGIPTGYKALNTYNLPDPVIEDPSKYFKATTHTGTGSSNAISGFGFSPDMTWIKKRNGSPDRDSALFDTVRGDNEILYPTDDYVEASVNGVEFDSDGYTLGTDSHINGSGDTYVAWSWDAGTANTSVSAGDLNSSAYNKSSTWSGSNNASTGPVKTESGSYYSGGYDGKWLFDGRPAYMVMSTAAGHWIEWTPADSAAADGGAEENFTFTDTVEVELYDATNSVDFTLTYSDDTTKTTRVASIGWTTIATGGGVLKKLKAESSNTSAGWNYWSGVRIDGKQLIDDDQSLEPNIPTLASTYRANPSAGFSIVKWDGHGSTTETLAHGLGAKPDFMICKKRSTGGNSWVVWHKHQAIDQYLTLNNSNAQASDWTLFNKHLNDSSHVFSLGANNSISDTGQTAVAWLWSEIEGYSKFGTYIGDASTATDNAWLNCGFKPAFVLIKQIDSTGYWSMWDSTRTPINDGTPDYVWGNTAGAEQNDYNVEFLSNGFKIRDGTAHLGGSGNYYIFAAFADKPFKYSNAV